MKPEDRRAALEDVLRGEPRAVVPARWFVEIIRGVMLKGVGADVLWLHLMVLGIMLMVLLLAAIRRTPVRLS